MYFGKYRGIVVENDDPEKQGRLKCKVPKLFGEKILDWAYPSQMFVGDKIGIYFTPQKDSFVWVEFEGGHPDHPIWSGGWWLQQKLPEEWTKDIDVIKTVAGHVVKFCNEKDAEKIIIQCKEGQYIELDSYNGSITIKDKQDQTIVMSNNGVVITDKGNQTIDMNGSQILATDSGGQYLKMTGSIIQLMGQGQIFLGGGVGFIENAFGHRLLLDSGAGISSTGERKMELSTPGQFQGFKVMEELLSMYNTVTGQSIECVPGTITIDAGGGLVNFV